MPNGPNEQLDLSDYPGYDESHASYASWRFLLWSTGWGSYKEIDAAVTKGELTVGKYPEGHEPPQDKDEER